MCGADAGGVGTPPYVGLLGGVDGVLWWWLSGVSLRGCFVWCRCRRGWHPALRGAVGWGGWWFVVMVFWGFVARVFCVVPMSAGLAPRPTRGLLGGCCWVGRDGIPPVVVITLACGMAHGQGGFFDRLGTLWRLRWPAGPAGLRHCAMQKSVHTGTPSALRKPVPRRPWSIICRSATRFSSSPLLRCWYCSPLSSWGAGACPAWSGCCLRAPCWGRMPWACSSAIRPSCCSAPWVCSTSCSALRSRSTW